jgi:hypothetical protein
MRLSRGPAGRGLPGRFGLTPHHATKNNEEPGSSDELWKAKTLARGSLVD